MFAPLLLSSERRRPSPLQGFVVFLCGSTGLAGDSLRYVRMLAGERAAHAAWDNLVLHCSGRTDAAPAACPVFDEELAGRYL